MTKIHERQAVSCPYGRAPSYLNWYLDTLGKDANSKTILTLRVPLEEVIGGVPGGLTLSRDVVARFAPIDDKEAPLQQTFAIFWAPKGGGPYPTFSGFITIAADEDYDSAWLQLEGAYDPPLGVAGEVFDAALGHRIAQATARMLLKQVAGALESIHREAMAK